MTRKVLFLAILLVPMSLGLFATTSQANTFTLQELGISPGAVTQVSVSGFYTGEVEAGIVNLVVDGVAMNGFCIDPFHFALSSSSGYQFLPLANAPKAPGTMNATQAGEISDLWAMAYSPTMTAEQAAGLQIAMWEIIGGSNFSVLGNDFGAGTFLSELQSYSGPGTNLIALSGPGQDYVVQRVPESGSTVAFFALAALALAFTHTFGLSFLTSNGLRDRSR